jgi:hypothetical protein
MPWLRVKATQTALGGNSVTSVTIDRIAVVQAHITEAVTRTSASSTLPEQEKNKLLAQSCAEACDLLKDWLADAWWDRSRPSSDTPIKEVVPTQKELASFLGPMLKASLARARQGGVDVPDSLVDEAREKVAATARRFPRMGRQQLFRQAADRVRILQEEVCGLASQIGAATRSAAETAAWRRKAWKALGKVSGVLLAVTLAMTSAGPHAVAQNTAEWGHAAVRAAEVITVHYIADRAEPSLRVAPSYSGPQIR